MTDHPPDLFDVANAIFSVTLPLFSRLISQGVVDREKLAGHVAGEIKQLRASVTISFASRQPRQRSPVRLRLSV